MTITKTISIHTSPAVVWSYVNNLANWPQWAIHNVHSAQRSEDGWWLMEGPRGVSKVKMHSGEATGLLDHEFIDPAEGRWQAPCRVVAGSEGAHLMITFTKPAAMPGDAFAVGMQLLDEELQQLKQVLEGGIS
jgi:hypothetical protein